MKKNLFLIFILIFNKITIAQIPIAYYPFNGNANATIGSLNGTVVGATLTSDRFGNANSAYSFDGNDYISFTNVPTTQVNNWALSAWIRPTSNMIEGTIVNNGFDDTGNSSNGYCMNVGNGTETGLGNRLGYVFGLNERNTTNATLALNTWHHVVMTRLSGTTRFYINGVLQAFTTSSTPLIPTQFRIGSSAGIRFFVGAIDEVRVYNVGLTTAQVVSLYNCAASNINLTGVTNNNQQTTEYINAPPTSPTGQTNTINAASNVTYRAGKAINLNAGFRANQGAIFKAEIGGCL
jgi:hypothetical protein